MTAYGTRARRAMPIPLSCGAWFLRCKDLIDSYQPDLVYFDDTDLPLGQTGLDIAAHYYNASHRSGHGERSKA